MNEPSKTYSKINDFSKTLISKAKKFINKENFKSHTKTFSMEIKNQKSKSPEISLKSINTYKDSLTNNSYNKIAANFLVNLSKNESSISSINFTNNNFTHNKSSFKLSNNTRNNIGNWNFVNNEKYQNISKNTGYNDLNIYKTNFNHLKNNLISRVSNNTKPGSSHKLNNNGNNNYNKLNNIPGHLRSKSHNIFA